MEKGYISINKIKQVVFTMSQKLYYFDYDSYGNAIEIEFGTNQYPDSILDLLQKKDLGVWVTRFYTSYMDKITTIEEPYFYHIPLKDFHKISRKSRFF